MRQALYKTNGIILGRIDWGEADRLLTIYSEDYGKIQARAKGARKLESKLKGFLEPFTHSRFQLARSRAIDVITDVVSLDAFSRLHASLELLRVAFYAGDLLDKLIAAPEKDERLWRLILTTFQRLDQNLSLSDFEEELLEILGYGDSAARENQPAAIFIQNLLGELTLARNSELY